MDTKDYTTGVSGTDTFEDWRRKTNGVIETVNAIPSSYASKDGVLLTNNTPQTVDGNKTFNGLIVSGGGGNVPLTSNSSSELVLNNNILISNGKSVSAHSLVSQSGILTLNQRSYTWPNQDNWNDGYVFHNAIDGTILFKSVADVATQVSNSIATSSLVSTHPVTPVGTVIGIKLTGTADNVLDGRWLKCDGETPYNSTDYPALASILGADPNGTFITPDLRTKVLIGSSGATGFIGATGAAGPSYYDVHYYIKAIPDNVATFSLTSGKGITLQGQGGTSSINLFGGSVSLNTSAEFSFDTSNKLLLADGGVNHTKLQNASPTVTTGAVGIPLRDTNGYVRGNTPGVIEPISPADSILTNKKYVDSFAGSKDHKIRALNGRGFNSYGVQPSNGCVFVNYDKRVNVYGLTNDSRGRRYGAYSDTEACGHTLPLYDRNVKKVYTDTYNTYILYEDNTVWSYGLNTTRKSGVTEKSITSQYLPGPKPAFNGASIKEVILSYDTNAETAYALTNDGRLWVAGDNTNGQLGLNSTQKSTSTDFLPSADGLAGKFITKAWLIGGGNTQTGYALANDNTLWACGYGGFGQMGRFQTRAINRQWVPVLDPVSVPFGKTTTRDVNIYTTTGSHGLQTYDVINIGSVYYVVKVLTSTTFELHKNDSLNDYASQSTPIVIGTSTPVHSRLVSVRDAAFGGTGSNTFGYIQTLDNSLLAWGFGTYGQLGNGSNAHRSIPTPVSKTIGSTVKAASVYTGLDWTVHFIAVTSGHLYACGDNRLGQLGISQNGGTRNQFEKVDLPDLIDTGLPITANDYSVHRFFSPGTDCRFCVFKSGTAMRLAAWGTNYENKLGSDNNANLYNRPQRVYVDNDSNVIDVQTTQIFGVNDDISTILIQDSNQEYGDLYTCGYHYYNINNVPFKTIIPYFTKVKNI
jgi:alpha-tubulin suppressor-like RCC1 family protein